MRLGEGRFRGIWKGRKNFLKSAVDLTGLVEAKPRVVAAAAPLDAQEHLAREALEAEGLDMIEEIFIRPWNGYWASPEQMGYPLVCMGSKIFSYMSGQTIFMDYGISNTWLYNPYWF